VGSDVSTPQVRTTPIPGLLEVSLPVHQDARGWFKENWQRAKMVALGLPDFQPVQHSVAFNEAAGTTRGVHAEPWDKLVSVASGRALGLWVDLRAGPTFGAVHTAELNPATAVFVPRGVGNAYQTLAEGVVYSYLVNAHWSPDAAYTHLNLADEHLRGRWPIPLEQAIISDKDRDHPHLDQVQPIAPPRTLILGANGQLGRALLDQLPGAHGLARSDLDLTSPERVAAYDFSDVATVINAAAFTAVDAAETPDGRRAAWATNATGVAALAQAARRHRFTLVHYSTDYVFEGAGGSGPGGAYRETDPIGPLNVYGQSKAAGELAVQHTPQHYLIRTSWVLGQGHNFVATMHALAGRGAKPAVVDDQLGRLTFAPDLARATAHLLTTAADWGTYHVTNSGEPATWAQIAREVFQHAGANPDDITPVSTAEYAAQTGKHHSNPNQAPRPSSSVLDLTKLQSTGLHMRDHRLALRHYLHTLRGQ